MDTSNLTDALGGGSIPDSVPIVAPPVGNTLGESTPPPPAAPAPPAPAGTPSVWKNLVMGAIYGLAGSAGAKSFGAGAAGGAEGVIAAKQRDIENQQRAQQLQFESVRAADSHILAQKQAQEADLAIAEHKSRLADNAAQLNAYLEDNGLKPIVTISGNNPNDMHAQAIGGLTTLAAANGGQVPFVATVNDPIGVGADKGNHEIRAYAATPAAVQNIAIDPKTTTVPKIVNDVRLAQGQLPLKDADWQQLGMTPALSDPSKGLDARTARQVAQKTAIEEALRFVTTPEITGGDSAEQITGKNSPIVFQAQQAIANYKTAGGDDSKFAALLQNRLDTLKSGVNDAGQRANTAKVSTVNATAVPEAQAAALKVVAMNTGAAGDAVAKQKAREAAIEQSVRTGNPADAGTLLAQRLTTLSELKSRGSTPAFIVNAIAAARKIDPDYNAQVEDNNAKIASSEANTQFFGNVNSLVAPGGTLDQLKQAGGLISQSDYRILNKAKNWTSLQSGSAGISAYAAKSVAVADDLGKVMAGSAGSDTSRSLVLATIDPSLSPAQRSDAVEAIREAVNSQKDSRIGNNSFLRKMYGTMPTPAGQPKIGDVKTFPNGAKGVFDGKGWVKQ
jgi:hypothetical protein